MDSTANIAIISDDLVFYNLLKLPILKKNPNVQTHICRTFHEMTDKLGTIKINLILIDGGMSLLSTVEVIRDIRLIKRISTPIWLFPEIQTNEFISKTKEMGVDIIINKPFDPLKVVDDIATFLKKTIH
jgi:DNA-binding response OmpR family regulator